MSEDCVQKALRLEPILSYVFLYLDVEDLTRCRLVNKIWCGVALTRLYNKALSVLTHPSCNCQKVYLPPTLLKNYRVQNNLNCHCLWKNKDFDQILGSYSKVLKDLFIKNVWINTTIVLTLNIATLLTSLEIKRLSGQFIIRLDNCNNLQHLSLGTGCTIELSNVKLKILLKTLRLWCVKIIPENAYTVNELFDLTKAKSITLSEIPGLSIDLSVSKNLKYLELSHVNIIQTENIMVTIDKLKIDLNSDTLKFKDFSKAKVRHCIANVSINQVNLLPRSVKILQLNLSRLTPDNEVDRNRLRNNVFDGLSTLLVEGGTPLQLKVLFVALSYCPMLKQVEFLKFDVPIVLESFPTSIENLVVGIDVDFKSEVNINVNTLALRLYTPERAFNILSKIKADTIVVKVMGQLQNYIEIPKCKSFVIGPVIKGSFNIFDPNCLDEICYIEFNNGIFSKCMNDLQFYLLFAKFLPDVVFE